MKYIYIQYLQKIDNKTLFDIAYIIIIVYILFYQYFNIIKMLLSTIYIKIEHTIRSDPDTCHKTNEKLHIKTCDNIFYHFLLKNNFNINIYYVKTRVFMATEMENGLPVYIFNHQI